MSARIGIITGTGFETLPGLEHGEKQEVQTPYGNVRVELGEMNGREIVLIPRHGKGHEVYPRHINYRANLYSLHMMGVEHILATSTSASLVLAWPPRTLVLVDQFLNFTRGREHSFYPLEDGKVVYFDTTDPYCSTIHQYLSESALELKIELQKGATYACFDTPGLGNRAETEMVRRLGGQLIGGTNFPEVVLARELAICYATVGVISNYAAGMQPTNTAREISENLEGIGDKLVHLFAGTIEKLPKNRTCMCSKALENSTL